jgi:multicomponent Na+:H+ antiporter subunit D
MYLLYTIIIPVIASALCAVLFLLGRSRIATYIAVLGPTLSLILFTVNWYSGHGDFVSLNSIANVLGFDTVALLIAYVVLAVGTIVTWYSVGYVKDVRPTYYPLLLIIISATIGAVLSYNLATFYIFFEVSTLAAVFLIAYNKGRALEAATKFIALNSIGSSLALLGIILLFVNSGTLDSTALGVLPKSSAYLISLLLFVGIGTKIGIVPLHAWVPDSYGEAPTPVSSFLASTVKAAMAFTLMRLIFAVSPTLDLVLFFVAVTAVITVGVGALMAYTQKDLKKIVAYSSIEQAGIIVFAIGIGSSAAVTAGIFHIINNMLMKALIFLCVGAVIIATKQRHIDNMSDLARKMPVVAVGFIIGAFALSGIPPLNGFLSEYMILQASFQKGGYYPILGTIMLILTLPMFAAYIKVLQKVFFRVDEKQTEKDEEREYLTTYIIIPIIILSILCILLGVYPTPVLDQINNISVALLR